MKKTAQNSICMLCLWMAWCSFYSCQKETFVTGKKQDSFTLQSTYTETQYDLKIAYPKTYDATKKYHTIYLLDGDDYFDEASAVISNQQREDVILIGIGYVGNNQRGRDYSFPKDSDFPNASGGAKEFIQFINNQLIPKVETEMGVKSKARTIYGHSLGGYFALYILFQQEHPNPFDNSIAISPNLMWKDAYLFDLEQQYYNQRDSLDKRIYMTVGDLEGASINLFFNAFKNKLLTRNYTGLSLDYERLSHVSHRNSPIISFKNALSIIL